MAVKFNSLTKHGKEQFVPSVALGFEDAGAEAYFKACGWASDTDETPVHVYPAGTVEIDPETRQNSTGLLVADLMQKGL